MEDKELREVESIMECLNLIGVSEQFTKMCIALYLYVKSGKFKNDLSIITQK